MSSLQRIPALDGVRAVAVLLVIAHHSGAPLSSGGYIGVDLFFVLSGFLITTLLVSEREKTGRLSLGKFYARRGLRLWPALLFMLVVVVILERLDVLVAPPGAKHGVLGALIAATYLSDVMAVWSPSSLDLFGHTWSLAVEEQFYLVWPLLLLLLLRRTPRPALWALAGALASAVGLVLGCSALHRPIASELLPFTHGSGLLLGCWLALGGSASRNRLVPLAGPAAVLLGCLVIWLPREYGLGRGLGSVAASVLAVPVVAFLLERTHARASVLLDLRAPRLVGKWSYALYLWNYPLILGLQFAHPSARPHLYAVAGALMSFPAAAVSSYVIERPFLRVKSRLQPLESDELSHASDAVVPVRPGTAPG